jgi:hypothetical protein
MADSYIAVCSAVIVFIPVFLLSTQGIKAPFQFTSFDKYLVGLLCWYIILLISALASKVLRFKYTKQEKGGFLEIRII